jgi:signal transduction histidine kinase
MASFPKNIQSASLPVKVASGAVLTAVVVIFLVVGFLRGAVQEAFESQLTSVLDEKAFQHRVRFSRSVEAYYYGVKLLSTQRSLIEHLQHHQEANYEHPLVSKAKAPVWLPNFTFLRSFIAPHYAFLFDAENRLIDLYQNWPIPAPEELQGLSISNLALATGQTHIIMLGPTPFLLAAEQVKDDEEKVVGTVLISTPLDEVFMIAANGPATNWNLVALIDDASGRVISSNSGLTIARGKKLNALTEKYMFTEPRFLALGGMELAFRFASLVNKDSIDLLSEGVVEKEMAAQFVTAFVYMSPFIVIVYWLTRRILRLTNKVEEFSLHDLGYEHVSLHDVKGDQIDILEQRFLQLTQDIKKRTSQLETANHELEAFAYSVSHDLRAPLRSIDGFSQALDEDYRDQLDETGHDYLLRVRKAAQRMGTLIDEMLMLSRVSRSEMKMHRVDLGKIAEQVIKDLQQNQPERDVEVKISEGLVAVGDEGLLRVVVTNLLDNAWKFTSKTEKPVIEFSQMDEKTNFDQGVWSSTVYCVADNGAGFDMEFVDKMFGAFQRLHRDAEFPGTGVGLATVQRIINRHEGKIWAESEPGKGAKFFFSI